MGSHYKVGRSLDQTHRSGCHQPQKHRSHEQKHGDSKRVIGQTIANLFNWFFHNHKGEPKGPLQGYYLHHRV